MSRQTIMLIDTLIETRRQIYNRRRSEIKTFYGGLYRKTRCVANSLDAVARYATNEAWQVLCNELQRQNARRIGRTQKQPQKGTQTCVIREQDV